MCAWLLPGSNTYLKESSDMNKIGICGLLLFTLNCMNNSSSSSSTVSLTVQNNRATAVMNLKVGSTSYGNVASGATTTSKSVSAGSQSVSSDSGESGTVTVPEKTSATLTISNTGSLSVQ